MACSRSIELLEDIVGATQQLAGIKQRSFVSNYDGWEIIKTGKSGFAKRIITFEGAAVTFVLLFPRAVQINRIEVSWDDATAKDQTIQIGQTLLDVVLANTSTSRIIQLGSEYKFPGGTKISFIYSANNTNGKIMTIAVQADEL